MREIRNILGWLGRAEEQSILQGAQKHVEETYKTVTYFAEAIKAFIQGDLPAEVAALENVKKSEHEADVLRSQMVKELSEGVFLPPDRAELLHFVKTLDKIADWTNGAGRILGFIEQRLPENILRNIAVGTEIIVKSITTLKEAIRALTANNLPQALVNCEQVDRLEHEADEQKRILIESIIHAKLEPTSLLLSFQLAEYLEGITDKMEDASDFIKEVAIASR